MGLCVIEATHFRHYCTNLERKSPGLLQREELQAYWFSHSKRWIRGGSRETAQLCSPRFDGLQVKTICSTVCSGRSSKWSC
ncbi:hypothetical protein ACET3Z_010346 [Daucus carota]